MKRLVISLMLLSSLLFAKQLNYKAADELMMCLHDGNKIYHAGNLTLGKNMRASGNMEAYLKNDKLTVKHLDKSGNVVITTKSKKLKVTDTLDCYEILSIDIAKDGKYTASESKMFQLAARLYGTAIEFELGLSNTDRYKKQAKERAKAYTEMWNNMYSQMPAPMGENMFKSTILKDEFNKYDQELKDLIIKELNTKGVKIPGINK